VAPKERPDLSGSPPQLLWVSSADYETAPERRIDPTPLARLLASWSTADRSALSADKQARELVENEQDGPIHLVRIVAAIESAARQTGGSLAHLTGTPAMTDADGGTLHHLIEILHAGGLRAATTACRTLDSHSRFLALTALRPYWQAPRRALCEPLHDTHVMPPNSLWRS